MIGPTSLVNFIYKFHIRLVAFGNTEVLLIGMLTSSF